MLSDELVWKEITDDETALQQYILSGDLLWGAHYPLDYLKRGIVYGCYLGDEMVGGYAFVLRGPFRTLTFLTDAMREKSATLKNAPETEFAEVAGFWFRPKVRIPMGSLALWEHFLQTALSLPQTYALYGYDFARQELFSLYQKLEPEILFRGPINEGNAPAGNHQGNVSIELVPMARAEKLLPIIQAKNWYFHRLRGREAQIAR